MESIDPIRAIPKDGGWAWMCLMGKLHQFGNTIQRGAIDTHHSLPMQESAAP